VLIGVAVFLSGYFLGWKTEPAVRIVPKPVNLPAVAFAQDAGVAPAHPPQSARETHSTEEERIELASLARRLIGGRDHTKSQTRVIAEISGMDSDGIRAGLEELEQVPATAVVQELRLHLLRRWATLQPRAAWSHARNGVSRSAEAPGFGTMAAALLQRWSTQDPEGALEAWAELSPDERSDGRNRWALRMVFSAMGARDLEQALARADTLDPSEKTEALRGLAVFASNEQHRNALLATFAALPAGELRTQVLGEALGQWAQKEPTEAIQWLDAAQLSPQNRGSLEETIAASWFVKDQASTAEWLMSRATSPSSRAKRLEMIVTQWAHGDPSACGQWLITQGLDSSASGAMRLYANTIAVNFPEKAVAWARSIPDEAARQRTLDQLRVRLRERYPRRVDELLAPLNSKTP